ncbi:hypothetical protein BX661DRAFT_185354 [Kickxella alabastrina]|uniref:Uncharacterized protein n=1 Tax=Kickxella alabastrina TaxID=61397 RepID=A0ACC1IUQ2_9FUNG|nr:uncharacterized protein BX661DRAFT_185354 [Kickxella alabastrina]KAI7824458.1 hypothetical protein BX661DRAFT_185354 [Kickxella alabastrina]KAJ1901220.1 hypothetical protein LPJ66_000934 [Kickxella alabastrina]KAJ1944681.1 hypothetical protein GGF37_002075 [Kickxella alabastrina]
MPYEPTPDNILHKLLHDRFYSSKICGERAILSLALQRFTDIKRQRQDATMREEEISRDIDLTESQIRTLGGSFDRYMQGLARYNPDDARVMGILSDKLVAQEARLRGVRRELAESEQRFVHIITTWATSKF